MASSNLREIAVILTPEQAEFLKANCDANMTSGLQSLEVLTSRDLQEKMVWYIENFKAVKAAVELAGG